VTVDIVPFEAAHAPAAAHAFVTELRALRRRVPALSAAFQDHVAVTERLSHARGYAAVEDGRLVGYLTSSHPLARFRRTGRTGAYVPEWGHAVIHPNVAGVYNALHRQASRAWVADGCGVHAISILAHQPAVLDTWFRAGFGLAIVDAVRPTSALGAVAPPGVRLRTATAGDAPDLADLDVEHVRHYAQPPMFMVSPPATAEEGWRRFLDTEGNVALLVEDGDGPFGFMRFTREFDGAAIMQDASGAFVSGAYVRPQRRQRGVAAALLDAGLQHLRQRGLRTCALDFESFNPEASAFWLRHFTPVCMSLMRIPEAAGG